MQLSWRVVPCHLSPLHSAAQSWVHPLSLATSFPPYSASQSWAHGTLSPLPSPQCSSAGAWCPATFPLSAVQLRAGRTHCLWPPASLPHPCSPAAQSVQRQIAWERQAWPSVKTPWYWALPSGSGKNAPVESHLGSTRRRESHMPAHRFIFQSGNRREKKAAFHPFLSPRISLLPNHQNGWGCFRFP